MKIINKIERKLDKMRTSRDEHREKTMAACAAKHAEEEI